MVPRREGGREQGREDWQEGMNAVGVPGSVCWLPGNEEVNAGAELLLTSPTLRGGQDGGSVCPGSLSTANAAARASPYSVLVEPGTGEGARVNLGK